MKQPDDSECVSINLSLDAETYASLKASARQSYRSLKMEATLRLIDHVCQLPEPCSTRLQNRPESSFKVLVPCSVRDQLNPYLYRGSYKTHSLSVESARRVKDHLRRFEAIAAVGLAGLCEKTEPGTESNN
ncbi:TraY domain-containing protein [Vibrio aerogenes]|uniref:TraY domain-containing protein n=1 Tax=Vibrio aerogenes TaxID=92172 RepID=UPI0021C2BE3F|nr:TraY domain-containing protein [Vibrio aerogenes]